MIAGDIVDTIRREGGLGGSIDLAAKYLGPLVLLETIDRMVGDEDSPMYSALTGKKGLSSWAPIQSVGPLTEGNLMQPPVIQALADGMASVVKGDPDAFLKWADNTARSFIPGMGMLRFLSTDLRGIQGEKPAERNIPAQIDAVTE
jgi:hypothetical protein